MAVDLSTWIFQDILKISPELLARYPTVQDQLLYLILIPHVVLFMFLYIFSLWFGEHVIIRRIVLVATYVYVIFSGFYSTVAAVASALYTILIPLAFVMFLIYKVAPWPLLHRGAKTVEDLAIRRRELDLFKEELRDINEGLKGMIKEIGEQTNDDELKRKAEEIFRNPYTMEEKKISQLVEKAILSMKNAGIGDEVVKQFTQELHNELRSRRTVIREIRRRERRGILGF